MATRDETGPTPPTVLLLRAEAAARRTAPVLERAGFRACTAPLIENVARDPGPLPAFASWIASSTALADTLGDDHVAILKRHPYAVVGQATASALRERTGRRPEFAAPAMRDLANEIASASHKGCWPQGPVLDAGGVHRAFDPRDLLADAGLLHRPIVFYEARETALDPKVEQNAAQGHYRVVWLSSPRIARLAFERYRFSPSTRFVAIGKGAQKEALRHGVAVYLAPTPDMDGMVTATRAAVAADATRSRQPTGGAAV